MEHARVMSAERYAEHYMFALEGLAELRYLATIKTFNVSGIPPWFAGCLQFCVTSKGGDPTYVDLSSKPRKGIAAKIPIVSRKKIETVYAWKSFAVSNDIWVPEEVCRLWGLK
jgi:hypothetical protein